MLKVVGYIWIFAIITICLYLWGMMKSRNKEQELLRSLYTKGANEVVKILKKNDSMTKKELERQISGISASLFYSKTKAIVQNPSSFIDGLLKEMMEEDIIYIEKQKGANRYKLKCKNEDRHNV